MTRAARALRLFYVMHFGAMGVYLPYFPNWLEAQGIHGFRMSAVVALLPALSLLSPYALGVAADTFGLRGSLLRIATLGALVSLLGLAVARWLVPANGYAVLFVLVLGFAFFRTPIQLLSDVVALEQPEDYGRVRMWGSIGFALAAPVAGRFVPLSPAWLLPACMTLPLAVAHLSSYALPKNTALPTAPVLGEMRALLREGRYWGFLLATVLGHGAHVAYELCISLRLRDLGFSGTWIGAAWTVATVSEVVLLALSHRLLARYPASYWLLFSLLLGVFRWVFLARVESLGWLMAFQPLHAVTFALRWVASIALVKRFAPSGSTATAQGLFLTATALGSMVGTLVWGTLYSRLGGGVFLGAAAVASLAAVAVVPLVGSELRRVQPTRTS